MSASNGTAEITALAGLINSAVQDIVNEYTKAGHAVPSLHSTERGPFGAPHLVSATLSKAIQTVEAACAQLTFTVANPGHTITNVTNISFFVVSLHATDGLIVIESICGAS